MNLTSAALSALKLNLDPPVLLGNALLLPRYQRSTEFLSGVDHLFRSSSVRHSTDVTSLAGVTLTTGRSY
jgi:hypothetical protein